MPRYWIVERRSYDYHYIVEADSEEEAQCFKGDVLEEYETDSWGEEIIRSEKVSDDYEL